MRITDLNNDGTINLYNEAVFINPSTDTKKQFSLNNNDIVIARSGSVGKSAIYKSSRYEKMIFASYLIRLTIDENKIIPDYLFLFTKTKMYWNQVEINSVTVTQPNLNAEKIKDFKIPLPPKEIQEKIVSEIEILEKEESKGTEKIANYKTEITQLLIADGANKNLGEICDMKAGKFVSAGDIKDNNSKDLYPCYGGNGLRGYTETFTHNGNYPLIGRQGALCGNVHFVTGKFHATEHAVVATPLVNILIRRHQTVIKQHI